MEPTLIPILILLGLGIAFLATIGGLGGGVFLVPFLDIVLVFDIIDAREVSFFMILFNSGIGVYSFLKQKRIHVKLGLIGAACTISGTLIFKTFFSGLSSNSVRLIFGWFLSILSIYFIVQLIAYYKNNKNKENPSDSGIGIIPDLKLKETIGKAIPIFLLSGFISALTGTGGGTINVPAMNVLLGFPIHFATSTSTFIILFTSGFNVILGIFQGKIELYLTIGVFIVLGGIIGAKLGAKVSSKFQKHVLKGIFGGILLYVGINLILKAAGLWS